MICILYLFQYIARKYTYYIYNVQIFFQINCILFFFLPLLKTITTYLPDFFLSIEVAYKLSAATR